MAYALQPLIHILEQHSNSDVNIKPQVEPLLAKAKFLRGCVENTSLYKSSENKELESRIRDAVYEAEDVIESYIVDSDSQLDLTEVIEIFDSIEEELLKIVGEKNTQATSSDRRLLSLPDQPAKLDWVLKSELQYSEGNIVVGFDQEFFHLVELLTHRNYSLQIIPIVGIGGGGKTTLAKRLYNHASILNHFDIQGWTTISQKYDLEVNLLDLLRSLGNFNNQMRNESHDELGERVYKTLRGRRYLIVVDDIWDMDAWDKMRSLFPDDENGSRVIITTRQPTVADYARLSSEPLQMRLLDADESWLLLVRKVFGHESLCPTELVETGKNISRCSQGLPLAIITMAGHLSMLEKTLQVWKKFEEQQMNSVKNVQEVDSNKNEVSDTQDDPFIEGVLNLFLADGHQLIELITGRQQELKITLIVGTGDSGKTNLAQLLYNRLSHAGRFDIHAWNTSSGHRKTKDTLREILHSLREGMCTNEMTPVNYDDEIGEHVHKTLYQRRYLVVLDNIKDVNNWDVLKRFFPDNRNGSRIILTAGEWNVTDYDRITPLRMNSYWEFLIRKAFEQDVIASKVEDNVRIFWELFETCQRSEHIKRDSQFDLILMSYDHLPCHLKPCFLYMGSFPEDYEIKVSKIINLWIAEGFVKPTEFKSFEGVAEIYLKDLLDRNLIFVSRRAPNGKVEAISIHDVFWKFCCNKAHEENFMWCKDLGVQSTPEDEEKIRRVCVQSLARDSDWMDLYFARSLLCIGPVSQDLTPVFLGLRLLRVLDVLQFVSAEFPEEMLHMFNLRYLAFTCHSHIPSSLSSFRFLQTLVIPGATSLPSTLWEMTRLRHIKCNDTQTWPVVEEHENSSAVVQDNLQSLSNIPSSVISEEFLRRFSGLRKLKIVFNATVHTSICLHRLARLENLKCSSDGSPETRHFLSFMQFPQTLVKLTLISCDIHSSDLHILGSLPHLEQLKLRMCYFMDTMWVTMDDGFRSLKVLHLEEFILKYWFTEGSHFPCLARLIIRGCHSMQEIPLDIGNIATLGLIEVDDCCPPLVNSALRILKEQWAFGNYMVRVSITNRRTDTDGYSDDCVLFG